MPGVSKAIRRRCRRIFFAAPPQVPMDGPPVGLGGAPDAALPPAEHTLPAAAEKPSAAPAPAPAAGLLTTKATPMGPFTTRPAPALARAALGSAGGPEAGGHFLPSAEAHPV